MKIGFKKLASTSAAVALAMASSLSQGAVVLSENFESVAAGKYATGANVGAFFVQSGSVDVLDPSFFGFLCSNAGGSAKCIDQDGTNSGATFSSTAFFPAGVYDLFFDIAGSQRGDTNTTTLFFGDQIIQYLLLSNSAFTNQAVLGVNVLSSSRIVFDNTTSQDSRGNLLDNVRLERREPNSVPEPSTLMLLLPALLGLGIALRRRRD